MGQCKYCGEDAGLFSHVHKECVKKHNQGVATLEDGIRRYFRDAINANGLKQIVAHEQGSCPPCALDFTFL